MTTSYVIRKTLSGVVPITVEKISSMLADVLGKVNQQICSVKKAITDKAEAEGNMRLLDMI